MATVDHCEHPVSFADVDAFEPCLANNSLSFSNTWAPKSLFTTELHTGELSPDFLFTDVAGAYYNSKPDPLSDIMLRPMIPNGSISGVFELDQEVKSDANNPYRTLRWSNLDKLTRPNSAPTPVTQSVGPVRVRVHQGSLGLSLPAVPTSPALSALEKKGLNLASSPSPASRLYDKPRRTRVPKKKMSSDTSDTDEEEGMNHKHDLPSSAEDKIIPEAEVPKYIKELGKKYGFNFVKAGGKVMGAHADRKSLDLKPRYKNKPKGGSGGTKRELLWTQKYVCSYTGQKKQKTSNGATGTAEPEDNFEDAQVGQKRKRGKTKWLCDSRIIVSVYADKRDEAVVREYHDHSVHAGESKFAQD